MNLNVRSFGCRLSKSGRDVNYKSSVNLSLQLLDVTSVNLSGLSFACHHHICWYLGTLSVLFSELIFQSSK